jgi:hypothetical protein
LARAARLRHEAERLRSGSALLYRIIDVPRYKDRADLELLPELERGIHAVARTIQADVHQSGFGSLSLRHAYGLLGTSCHADHLEPGRGELAFQVERDQHFIFNDKDPPSGRGAPLLA